MKIIYHHTTSYFNFLKKVYLDLLFIYFALWWVFLFSVMLLGDGNVRLHEHNTAILITELMVALLITACGFVHFINKLKRMKGHRG